jgi:acetolactate decarboxylase
MLDPHLVSASHGHVHQIDAVTDLLHGNYESITTVGQVFPFSILGLGVADRLDGEIVSIDGQTWRIPATGTPELAPTDLGMPFAISAEGGTPLTVEVPQGTTYIQLASIIDSAIHRHRESDYFVAAIRIDGIFSDVLLRSEHRQDPPFMHLDQVLRTEVQFAHESWQGTLVGFVFPLAGSDQVTIPGLHLHAISQDRTSGGHVHHAICDSVQLHMWLDDLDIIVPQSRVSHAFEVLDQVATHGGPQQRAEAIRLKGHLESSDATAEDFAQAIALHDAYLNDPYIEKSY